jgi:undecaprenyl-diphosphatase
VVEVRVVDPLRLAGVGLLAAAAAVVGLVESVDTVPGEESLLRALVVEPGSATAGVAGVVSDATDLLPLAAVALAGALALLATRRWRSLGVLLAGVAVPWAVNPLLKDLFARPRPDLVPLSDASAYSLPAGHATNTAALVLATLAVLLPRLARRPGRLAAVLAVGLVLVTATAQLVLARHWPTDVIAGWLIAAGWVALVVSAAATDAAEPS